MWKCSGRAAGEWPTGVCWALVGENRVSCNSVGDEQMTLAGDLSERTLARVIDRFDFREETGADGGAYLPLPGPMPGAGGVVRVWTGDGPIARVVYCGIAFPPAGLDSHMIFAFGRSDNAIPHFTLDSIAAPGMYAFHLDLIQRVDLGANLGYMDAVYGELTDTYDEARKLEGLSEAALSPRQYALMSPWMLASRADEAAFTAIEGYVQTYFDRWAKLVENGLPAGADAGMDGSALAVRDQRNRDALFNADVDPVWNQIAPIIGEDACTRIMEILRGHEL